MHTYTHAYKRMHAYTHAYKRIHTRIQALVSTQAYIHTHTALVLRFVNVIRRACICMCGSCAALLKTIHSATKWADQLAHDARVRGLHDVADPTPAPLRAARHAGGQSSVCRLLRPLCDAGRLRPVRTLVSFFLLVPRPWVRARVPGPVGRWRVARARPAHK